MIFLTIVNNEIRPTFCLFSPMFQLCVPTYIQDKYQQNIKITWTNIQKYISQRLQVTKEIDFYKVHLTNDKDLKISLKDIH